MKKGSKGVTEKRCRAEDLNLSEEIGYEGRKEIAVQKFSGSLSDPTEIQSESELRTKPSTEVEDPRKREKLASVDEETNNPRRRLI